MDYLLTDEEWEAPLDPETEAQIDEVMRNARDPDDADVAVSASFDVPSRTLTLVLKDGRRLSIPQAELEDIYQANPVDLRNPELIGGGTSVHFNEASTGVLVHYLQQGFYGSDRWMEALPDRRRMLASAALARTA